MKNKKIALFHPWIKSKGGAERVVLEIAQNSKHDVDIYTWVYDKENTFEDFEKENIKVIGPEWLSKKISRSFLLRGLFLPISFFSKIPLEKYNIFLISTSGVAEFITFRNYLKNKTGVYCHTILRAAYNKNIKWNLKNRYSNPISKLLYFLADKKYQFFEKIAWKRIDWAIFNSDISMKRAKEHKLLKKKKQAIVCPPINVDKFSKLKVKNKGYFLYVSRFSKDKRQDLVLKAWKKFNKKHPKQKLVLIGNIESKKYFKKIKKLAKNIPNVEIKTNVKEKELLRQYANCFAGIFTAYKEDFGIVPFEFLSAGKYLIAVEGGGYEKIIKDYPQAIIFKEHEDKKDFIKEINKNLEKALKSKKEPEKIKFIHLNSKKFVKNVDKFLGEIE